MNHPISRSLAGEASGELHLSGCTLALKLPLGGGPVRPPTRRTFCRGLKSIFK